MKHIFRGTAGGKAGAIDGLNLFFGALLGANLGSMQHMALFDYAQLIVLLAGTVMVLRMLSTSERRTYMLITLAFYVAIIAAVLLVPKLQPKGMPLEDLHRLIVTLAIWVVFVLASELTPMHAAEASE
jgi:predicted membrane channel-forming protein YqfA (hemolysin III family)